ncbi:Autophagy-related protein 9 [Mycena kentingensis (nom. inval.)]|nr:Autophagy-related protein 9 [Mycena kentingensis (nom. inval.)]
MSSKYAARKPSTLFDSPVEATAANAGDGSPARPKHQLSQAADSEASLNASRCQKPATRETAVICVPAQRRARYVYPLSRNDASFINSKPLPALSAHSRPAARKTTVNNATFVNPKPLSALSKSAPQHHTHTAGHLDSLARIRQVPIGIPFAPAHGPCTIGIAVEDVLQDIGLLSPESRSDSETSNAASDTSSSDSETSSSDSDIEVVSVNVKSKAQRGLKRKRGRRSSTDSDSESDSDFSDDLDLYKPSPPPEPQRINRSAWGTRRRAQSPSTSATIVHPHLSQFFKSYNFAYNPSQQYNALRKSKRETWTQADSVAANARTAVGIVPVPESVEECSKAIDDAHVNIVDLLDTKNTGRKVEIFATVEELSDYTSRTGRFFPQKLAAGTLLQRLLRHLSEQGFSG